MIGNDICYLTAREIIENIRIRKLSSVEVMEAHLMQIEKVNPTVNAIVTLHPDLAMDGAKAADEAISKGDELGPLHGLPTAVKDLTPTKGIRTTYDLPYTRITFLVRMRLSSSESKMLEQ